MTIMSATWHESQSRHNMAVYYFLHTRHPDYIDWQITALFYAALHLVDAYSERNGIDVRQNHLGRKKLMKQELPLLYDSYDTLYDLSIKARYVFGNRLKDVDERAALRCFSQIKEYMDSM